MSEQTIEYMPVDEIEPEPENPRTHASLKDVKDSILRFGYVDPIIRDERTGRLIAGHGRIEALTELQKSEKMPPRMISIKDGRWHVPVVRGWASEDDEEALGVLVALNRHVETGGWDDGGLLSIVQRLRDSVDGLEGVGFTEDQVTALERIVEATNGDLDALKEWSEAGMPGYESQNLESAFKVTVHFATDDDADEFFKMLDRPRKSIMWWPKDDGHRGMNAGLQIVSEA